MRQSRTNGGSSAAPKPRRDETPGDLLSALRRMVPSYPLTLRQAFALAERQALKLLRELDLAPGAVAVDALQRVTSAWSILYDANLPSSGLTTWNATTERWVSIINAHEPHVRQRFSVAHELKHLIDDPSRFVLYLRSDGSPWDQADIEAVCDYFAGCVLLPRPWLKQAFTAGLQREAQLADHFVMSRAAVRVRLAQLGLNVFVPRCGSIGRVVTRSTTAAPAPPPSPVRVSGPGPYLRSSSLLFRGGIMKLDAISGQHQPAVDRLKAEGRIRAADLLQLSRTPSSLPMMEALQVAA